MFFYDLLFCYRAPFDPAYGKPHVYKFSSFLGTKTTVGPHISILYLAIM